MDLKIISYNPTGFNLGKANFINFLCNSMAIDIFVLQEHMHLRQNVCKIQNEFANFDSFIVPASKSNNSVCSGRPSGGLGIFWKKSLTSNIKMIKHPDSVRTQAIELCGNYLLINVYFPTDPQIANFDDFNLLKCIEDVKWFINSFPNHKFIIAGDLNCDMSRNSRFVNIIREFFLNCNLISAWSSFNVDFTFSSHQTRNGNNIFSSSVIDHFVVEPNILSDISHAQVIHLGDNLSNHDPIFLNIQIDTVPIVSQVDNTNETANYPKPVWHKASDVHLYNYRRDLKSNLYNLVLTDGVLCNDPTCSDNNHHKDILE